MQMDKTESVVQKLKGLTENLLFQSEGEYPFEIFVWQELAQDPSISEENLFSKTGHTPGTQITSTEIDSFFHRSVQEQDWYGDAEKNAVTKFQELLEFLKNNLENIKVLKVGEFEMDTFILGQLGNDTVGLKTKVIQT